MFTELKIYQRDRDAETGKYMNPRLWNVLTVNDYADLRDKVREDEGLFGCEHINLGNGIWCINLGFMERFYVFN